MGDQPLFGVYIGNCSGTVGVYKDGKADVLAADNGERITPAVVGFQDSAQVVGRPALQRAARFPRSCILGVPRVLGLSLEQAIKNGAEKCSVVGAKEASTLFVVEDGETTKQLYPSELLTTIAKQLLTTARSTGSGACCAVPVVPGDYSERRMDLVKRAYERAGFEVRRVIHAAPAALLAYGIGQASTEEEPRLCVVARVGGCSTELNVLRVVSGVYQSLASVLEQGVGGEALTDRLMLHLATDFKRQYRNTILEEGTRGWRRLRQAASNSKHILATMPTASCAVDSLHDGMDFHTSITRPRFDSLLTDVLQKLHQMCAQVCKQAGVGVRDINTLVLCGGTCKTLSVQQCLTQAFPSAELLSSIPPDEVLARGAATQSALLSAYDDEQLVRHMECVEAECLPEDICVKVTRGQNEADVVTLLPAFTPAPARRHRTLQLPKAAAAGAEVSLLQGGELLAQLQIPELPDSAHAIDVHAHLRRDGSLHLVAKELMSEHTAEVLIEAC